MSMHGSSVKTHTLTPSFIPARCMITKKLPHLSGMRQWVYTCKTAHYSWQTIVMAKSIKEARRMGYRDALAIMGKCAVIRSDEVRPA